MITSTDLTEGPNPVEVTDGTRRERTSATMNTSGDFLVAKNTGPASVTVKVWVEE